MIVYKGGTNPYSIIIGDSNGMLHQFNLDGHRFLRTQLPSTQPIVSLTRSAGFIAAAAGDQFTFVSMQGKHLLGALKVILCSLWVHPSFLCRIKKIEEFLYCTCKHR
jgi:hypothetical protein